VEGKDDSYGWFTMDDSQRVDSSKPISVPPSISAEPIHPHTKVEEVAVKAIPKELAPPEKAMSERKITRQSQLSLPFWTRVYNVFAKLFSWPTIDLQDPQKVLLHMKVKAFDKDKDPGFEVSDKFAKDANRATFEIGGKQVHYEDVKKELQKAGHEATHELVMRSMSDRLSAQLRDAFRGVGRALDGATLHSLRYQLQEAATQELFFEPLQPFVKKSLERNINPQDSTVGLNEGNLHYLAKKESQDLVENFNRDSIKYEFLTKGDQLIIRGEKKFILQSIETGQVLGFDALRVEVTIDLKKLDPTKPLTQQPEGTVQTTSSILGRKDSWQETHF
jgi:hypothetical protein